MFHLSYIHSLTGVEDFVLIRDKTCKGGDGIAEDGKGLCVHAGSVFYSFSLCKRLWYAGCGGLHGYEDFGS